jgi:predicted PurR-regulated permease PerM
MDEHPTEQETHAPAAEAPAVTIPSTAMMAQATAQAAGGRSGGRKVTPAGVMEQAAALQNAEAIKQIQRQMKALEGQTKDTGKVFLATLTSLVTSAFALVAALAWNEAIQDLFKFIFPPKDQTPALVVTQGQIIGEFGYALTVTIIVVLVIFYLTRLNTRLGAKSLIGEAGGGEGESKKK